MSQGIAAAATVTVFSQRKDKKETIGRNKEIKTKQNGGLEVLTDVLVPALLSSGDTDPGLQHHHNAGGSG